MLNITHAKAMKNRVSIYWDFENVRVPDRAECLIDFAQSRGDLITKKVYSHWRRETSASEYALDGVGFDRIDVQEEFENSADLQLESDCLKELFSSLSPDIIILVSGDKDFAFLVRQLQRYQKQVIIFGRQGVTSYKLILLADEFHFAEELCQLVA
ncbi:NYN domain-containing protein [Argonema galeatum]|uniref:NYN domain-containing protein n=1 Tax=Argonema galeatum TaxID=2942762 RepID=UPI0020130FB4|nr:NYN domain-containing protein [Argonema galeatum]MCL1465800.1 NYN domain-containing protein [Argonema galeatum A003/A1]